MRSCSVALIPVSYRTMRWLAIWLLLTGTWLAGWVATGWFLHGRLVLSGESMACLAAFRRMFREAPATTQGAQER